MTRRDSRAMRDMELLPPGSPLDREMGEAALYLTAAYMESCTNDSMDKIRLLEWAVRQHAKATGTNLWETYAALEFILHGLRAKLLEKSRN